MKSKQLVTIQEGVTKKRQFDLKEWDTAMRDSRVLQSNTPLTQLSSKKEIFCNQVKEYCDHTGLHGVRYLGESSRALVERIWWALAILISLVGISMLIFKVWDRWTSSPVIVSFAEIPTPIWQIPFPAVTICPQVKYKKDIIDRLDLEQHRDDLTKDQLKILNDLMLICKDLTEQSIYDDEKYPDFADESSISNILKMAPSLSDVIECAYQFNTSCTDYLQTIITRDGVCFSFNLMPNGTLYSDYTVQGAAGSMTNQEELWSLEHGFSSAAGIENSPLRALGTGYKMALNMHLMADKLSLDYECRRIQGFKISFSNPAEAPRMMERYFFIPISGLTQLVVEPKVMETSESLRSYPPEKRHCIFPSERRLAFFTTYTQSNCELECLTNFTLKECGCVEFYMARKRTTPICGLRKTSCVLYAELKLAEDLMHESIKHLTNNNTCNCQPECKSIQYSAEVSQGDFEITVATNTLGALDEKYNNLSINFVFIFFKSSEFYASRRSELYGYADFLANCGGLLGLCCGFSILSLVEIVYYFTLRLWVNFRRQNQMTQQ